MNAIAVNRLKKINLSSGLFSLHFLNMGEIKQTLEFKDLFNIELMCVHSYHCLLEYSRFKISSFLVKLVDKITTRAALKKARHKRFQHNEDSPPLAPRNSLLKAPVRRSSRRNINKNREETYQNTER